jgi:hypothetical protein
VVGPPFSNSAEGRLFSSPEEGRMDTTSIVVIAIAVVFMGIIGALALYANRPDDKKGENEKGR